MKKIILLLLGSLSSTCWALNQFSFNTSLGTREQQVSMDVARLWKVGETKLFLGLGVRGTSQTASGQTFVTAPAQLTTGSEGPQVIFQQNKKNNIDEMTFRGTQVTSLNVAFYILYQHSTDWSFGTNIDVIGGSFGRKVKGKFNPKEDDSSWPQNVSARPSPFNLLLVSDNDIGSLNSEFFARKNLGQGWGLKFGANFAFTEYTTTQKLRKNNDRFRHKALLPTIGLSKEF